MAKANNVRDEFAELYVAGLFADKKWTVYFPRRDKGFDFIITKRIEHPDGQVLIRPVQVKGVYPEDDKQDQRAFGKTVRLTAVHPQLVLAIPFFESSKEKKASPQHVGYFPLWRTKITNDGRYRIHPATLRRGIIDSRKEYKQFFGDAGIAAIELPDWGHAASHMKAK